MAKTAEREKGRGIVLAPDRPRDEVWLDVLAYREASANVTFTKNVETRDEGHLTVRILTGAGVGHDLSVDFEGKDAGVWDGNSGRPQGREYLFNIQAENWRSLVAFHGALGAALAKAREIGWCDTVARFHGSDAALMGSTAEGDDQ